jgi:hypothetical protein|tara:strand:- start:403 stop:627 length:225 start_codon:yes stop_codon:yes gene_type:complete
MKNSILKKFSLLTVLLIFFISSALHSSCFNHCAESINDGWCEEGYCFIEDPGSPYPYYTCNLADSGRLKCVEIE